MEPDLSRFLTAQNHVYPTALSEISKGLKESHWMWYVFPQLRGLGRSDTAIYFSIGGMAEATAYLGHPVLGSHLIEISTVLYQLQGSTAAQIFGWPDELKLRSCMTLFAAVQGADPIFGQVIEKYFGGIPDPRTLELLGTGTPIGNRNDQ
ncbi:DUF1810 domain-containing protein [Pedobacter sp.]